jgi:hypothetical protein
MKVGHDIKGRATFILEAETAEDQALLDALDMDRAAFVVGMARKASSEVTGAYVNASAVLEVSRPPLFGNLVIDPVRKPVRCVCQLQRLGLSQEPNNGHVRTHAADPQPHVALATSLEQLKLVSQALCLVIGQAETVLKEMQSTHGDSSAKGPMVAGGGQA